MQALVYTDTEELIYREEKNPKLLNGESIIKVSASGICGSDMHAYHGKDERRVAPLILGHEVSGIIDQGKNKDMKVVVNPLITCGNCYYCNSDREHLCSTRVLVGMNRPVERQGAFAELVAIPNKNIYQLPDKLNIKEAPIAEPTAVSLHAVELGEKLFVGQFTNCRVLVIGSGAIGLLCGLILSKIKKCKEIVVVDPNNKRLDVCSKYLKAKTVNPNSSTIQENGFDVVFDTVGLEVTRQDSIKAIKPGGVIIHIGLTQSSGQFNFRKATLQEVTFVGTYCYTNKDFKNTLGILSNKKLGNLGWIEYRELKNGAGAFKEIHNGTCSAPKIILVP